MNEDVEAPALPDWKRSDKAILISFVVSMIIFGCVGLLALITSYADPDPDNDMDFFALVSMFFSILLVSFIIAGFVAFKHHHKRGIIPTKKVFRFYAIASLISSFPITALLLFVSEVDTQDLGRVAAAAGGIFIGMFVAIFLILILFTIAGFGVFGLVSVVQRQQTARLLVKVKEITRYTDDTVKMRGRMEHRGLQWLFRIPDVIDTGTLRIDRTSPRDRFPWKIFASAFGWEIFFSVVLAIYVSLNPFLFEIGDFQQRFSLSSSLSIVIPIIIIPWFIYLRLNARIKGPVKDFKLFDGIKSRMVGTLAAFGTLIVFIRFALRHIDAFEILGHFGFFISTFTLGTIFFTFVYFNYFEDDLASFVAGDYQRLVSKPA